MYNQQLARKNLEKRLSPLRRADDLMPPSRGWIRAIRDALGMTTAQLGRRIGVDQSRIIRLEKAEAEGAVTLKTLRHAAEGLGCTLVYALVPHQKMDTMLRDRAQEIAERQLLNTHHTMVLENQALSVNDLHAERERLIEQLMTGSARRLWDEG